MLATLIFFSTLHGSLQVNDLGRPPADRVVNRTARVVHSARPESFTYRKTLPREETNTLNVFRNLLIWQYYMTGTRIRHAMRKPRKREPPSPPVARRESNHAAALQPRACPQPARSRWSDVMNAIDCLTQICGEELRDGHEVHIEGLGLLCPHPGSHTESDPQLPRTST